MRISSSKKIFLKKNMSLKVSGTFATNNSYQDITIIFAVTLKSNIKDNIITRNRLYREIYIPF